MITQYSSSDLAAAASNAPESLQRGFSAIQSRRFDEVLGGDGQPPIDIAVAITGDCIPEHANRSLAELLFDPDARNTLLSWRDKLGLNITCRAAALGNLPLIQRLLANHIFQLTSDQGSVSPLALAAQFGHVDVFRLIANDGEVGRSQVSAVDDLQRSPAHYCAAGGHIPVLQEIKGIGLDPSAADSLGSTPLHQALTSEQTPLACYLISTLPKNSLGHPDQLGSTPLHIAVRTGSLDAVVALVEQGVRTDPRDHQLNTPLHNAAQGQHFNIARVLCKANASSVKAPNLRAETPLGIAKRVGDLALKTLFKGAIAQDELFAPSERLCIRNVAFKGGGVKGIGEIGAWEELCTQIDRHPHLSRQDIKRVAGTSAGAIMALLVTLGFQPDEMVRVLNELNDIDQLFDPDPELPHLADRAKKYLVDHPPDLGMLWSMVSVARVWEASEWKSFSLASGICVGDKLLELIRGLLVAKGLSRNATFEELHRAKGIELWVVATNLATERYELFGPTTTPYACVADAVRCSASFPIFFRPHYKFEMKNGQRVADQQFPYVDGGLMLNYPLRIFDDIDDPDCTIGIRIVKDKQLRTTEPEAPAPGTSTQLTSVVKHILRCIKRGAGQWEDSELHRSILISDMEKGTLDGSLTEGEKRGLIALGKQGTRRYFKDYGSRFREIRHIRVTDQQLHLLVSHSHKLTVETRGNHRYISDWRKNDASTPELIIELLAAAEDREGEEEAIGLIQSLGLSDGSRNANGESALQLAIRRKELRVSRILVERFHSNPNQGSPLPLDQATWLGDAGMVEMLLECGATQCTDFERFRAIADSLIGNARPDAKRRLKRVIEKIERAKTSDADSSSLGFGRGEARLTASLLRSAGSRSQSSQRSPDHRCAARIGQQTVVFNAQASELAIYDSGGAIETAVHSDTVFSMASWTEDSAIIGLENGRVGSIGGNANLVMASPQHSGAVESLVRISDRLFASGSADAEVYIWDYANELTLADKLTVPSRVLFEGVTIHLFVHKAVLYAGTSGGQIASWSVSENDNDFGFISSSAPPNSSDPGPILGFAALDDCLVAMNYEGDLFRNNSWSHIEEQIRSIARLGMRVIGLGTMKGTIEILGPHDMAVSRSLRHRADVEVQHLAALNNNRFASIGDDHSVITWDLGSYSKLREIGLDSPVVAVIPTNESNFMVVSKKEVVRHSSSKKKKARRRREKL